MPTLTGIDKQNVLVPVGVDTHADVHVAAALTNSVASWVRIRLRPHQPAMRHWLAGRSNSGRWSGLGSRVLVAMGQDWLAGSMPAATWWWRSSVPNGKLADALGSQTPSMPKRPHALYRLAQPPDSPKPATARSR